MKRLGIAATMLLLGTATVQAQTADPQCTRSAAIPSTNDACQKAIDFMKSLSPQIGAGIAGGNTILGSGGVLGGLPHWTVGVRARSEEHTSELQSRFGLS